MKFQYAPSIGQKLLMLITVCVVPMGMLSAYMINFDYQQTRESYTLIAQASSDISAAGLDTLLVRTENTLTMLANTPSLRQPGLRSFEAEARDAGKIAGSLCIVLRDEKGRQVINTSLPAGAPLPTEVVLAPVAAASRGFSIWTSATSSNPATENAVVVVAINVPVAGIGLGTLSAEIPVGHLQELLRFESGLEHQVQIIFDRAGNIISASSDAEYQVRQLVDLLTNATIRSGQGLRLSTADDRGWLLAASHAMNVQWTVATAIPERTLQSQALSKLWTFSSGIALMCVVGALVALLITRRIGGSVRALVGPALALGSGRDMQIPRLHMKEAQEVAAALVTAADMLKRAQYEASHDTLTGLANRALMRDYLQRQLDICERNLSSLTVVYIDLDKFKCVNDTYGHHVGDQLLVAASKRLASRIRKSDMIARMGGDEFVIILVAEETEARQIAAKIQAQMGEHYSIDGLTLHTPASMGTAIYPQCGTTVNDLINSADAAMYNAKGRPQECRAAMQEQ